MEIIDELEPHRRGPYAGAVGYIDFTGNMDTCIALRTVAIHNGIAYLQVGAGIVADSVPETEFQETMNKARGMLKAIEVTQKRPQIIRAFPRLSPREAARSYHLLPRRRPPASVIRQSGLCIQVVGRRR